VLAVELPDALRVDQLDREVAVLDAPRGQRRQRRGAQAFGRPDELEIDQGL
jgi:hypothetical protein